MSSITSKLVSFGIGIAAFAKSLVGWLTHRAVYNAGKAAGEKKAAEQQAQAEQEVVALTTAMRNAPKVSTEGSVDKATLLERIREGKF